MRLALYSLFALTCISAGAQTITVIPPSPDSSSQIQIQVKGTNQTSEPIYFYTFVVVGQTVRVVGCVPPGLDTPSDYQFSAGIGALGPGAYTIEYYVLYCGPPGQPGNPSGPLLRFATLGLTVLPGALPFVAAPRLDNSFGANGIAQLPFATGPGAAGWVSAKRDGNILAYGRYVGGYTAFGSAIYYPVLAQFRPNGSLDLDFGVRGFAPISSVVPPLVQRDDKIVGVTIAGLERLNSDGSPDTGFISHVSAGLAWYGNFSATTKLAQQADGKILAAGNEAPPSALVRFNTDGSRDLTFGQAGVALVPPGDSIVGLTIQPDGKIVLAAESQVSIVTGNTTAFTLLRYNPDGTPDAAFGNNGRVSALGVLGANAEDHPGGVILQPSGRLIVYGDEDFVMGGISSSPGHGLLVAFTSAGVVDGTFGTAGAVRIQGTAGSTILDAKVQTDGRLLIGFYTVASGHQLTRLSVAGAIDTAFGNAGVLTSPFAFYSIALQSDGNILAAGATSFGTPPGTFALERFLSGPSAAIEFYNPSLDHYFLSMNPMEVADLDLGVHTGWQRTGLSIPVFGSFTTAIATASMLSTSPVCRFYIPPLHGDSHFFSADVFECQTARGKGATDPSFSGYIEETAAAFFVGSPNYLTGDCPSGTVPIYRLWNARFDSNHRYTTDPAIKAQMVARGYVAEGYGPNAVVMCAPQ